MKKVLVLGGTRFFGKRLVQLLADSGAEVTVATRGLAEADLPPQVKRLTLDRDDKSALATAGEQQWDIVYDNICYSYQNAVDACEVFCGKVGKYVLTSTLSVYDFSDQALKEEAFDPYTYPLRPGTWEGVSYQEGKRQAEAVFFQTAAFPVAAVRFPIVLAEDDYTRRLHFHVEHVQQEQPIGLVNPEAVMCFIHAGEAAKFLAWVGTDAFTGPVNANSQGTITLQALLDMISQAVGKPARIEAETDPAHQSPFGFPHSFFMDTSKAAAAGYAFAALDSWLPELIQSIAKETVQAKA
ncbi:NAD dependent epimerase/dehydratase [Brevibacillus agri]|uniref:NAD dependent epimerase/dehydratase n=1 Tax=Brevibacillus agri TaxID=51101 RepID=A0A3M8AZ93_9BACL|nr:NAD-dependent epimerase/dehydratase family protein [Brevibacillus agri]MED3496972.1 NAD-dependent epimerase/dehydratase family protein [Brevibacillus agri]QAV13550.1 NAD-dependent dehydratase [Brevibacillus agri]RNB56412.1 NAD-dependent epimerase/dehydratase family protein [Brevibacillus agri]GED24375.1 NAD dependent epimerase/dehydratase [Brevibacillus agri]